MHTERPYEIDFSVGQNLLYGRYPFGCFFLYHLNLTDLHCLKRAVMAFGRNTGAAG